MLYQSSGIWNGIRLILHVSHVNYSNDQGAQTRVLGRDGNMWIILGSRSTLSLMGRVLFNCNRVFREFGFIFSNLGQVRGRFGYCYAPHPNYLLKIIFYYFILYFNINNNNENIF